MANPSHDPRRSCADFPPSALAALRRIQTDRTPDAASLIGGTAALLACACFLAVILLGLGVIR